MMFYPSVQFRRFAVVVCLLGMTGFSQIASAQVPSGDLPGSVADGELPTIELAPVPQATTNPQRTEQKIRAALDRSLLDGDADPVLDEILQIIRRRGSVLQGSTLDPDLANEELVPGSVMAGELTTSDVDKRALAAELLLRSARILSKLVPLDSAQRELVAQIRQQAVKLLSP